MTSKDEALKPLALQVSDSCCAQPPPGASSCCDGQASAVGDAAIESTASCCDGAIPQTNNASVRDRLAVVFSAWTVIVLLPLLVSIIDRPRLGEVLSIALTALSGTAPYILFAVLLIAYLKASGAEHRVASAFVGRENRMIVLAALFGGLAPFCSCEVIPFIAGLLALGTPVSAVMAFWLSSPLIDPPSLMITAGALGWEFALGKALAAIFIGLLGGFGVRYLITSAAFANPLKSSQAGACSTGGCQLGDPLAGVTCWKFWQERQRVKLFTDQARENVLFLFKWLSLAYLLEALLMLYIPASLIGGVVGGDGIGAIAMGALVGMPAYLNSYAAPALVAGLMEQGMSAGAAMAFMVAGAISSIPAMTAVWSLVKRPVLVAYLVFGVGGAILFAAVFALFVGP